MIKKKSKSKTATGKSKPAKTTGAKKSKKELNPADVRKEIAQMVDTEAAKMAQAVIGEGMKGQLATVKYLFEVAEIYPASTDGGQATENEDCLARTLLDRLDIPTEPVGRDEEDEPMKRRAIGAAPQKDADEKETNKQDAQQKSSEPETSGEESKDVSALA
jgi:hypothetical protein